MTQTLQAGAMKKAALTLAGRGWAVHALTVGGKNPATTHGQDDATTDPEAIERMWRDATFANIGINCARSGLYVVDVDMNPWKGKVGRDTWTRLVAEHGHVDTFTVKTWSGGLHFYYRMPPGLNLTSTTGEGGNTGRGLGVDIDTRGNGYVVAPGSRVTEDGHTGWYEIEHDLPIADLPQWIIDRVSVSERVAPDPALAGPLAADEMLLARIEALQLELEAAPKGEGNATAARIAYMVGQYVGAGQIGEDEAVGLLLDAIAGWTYDLPRDERTMQSTIIRQVGKGMEKPRAWERPVAKRVSPAASAPSAAQIVAEAQPVVPDPFTVPQTEQDVDPMEEAERQISMWATDNGQGVWLRDRIGDMLYAVGVGWLVWDDTRWKRVAPEVIQNKISRFYREQFNRMLKKYMNDLDEKYNVMAKAYKGFMSSARLGSIMNHLKVTDGVLVDASDLDTHKDLLNTPGGVVNLRNGQIQPHKRTLLFTKITRGSYRPGLTHPDWKTALEALPQAEADYMQIRMGQAITGYIPEADDAIFLIGHGSNGKSLWTSDGVLRAIGDYGTLAQATLISKQSESGGPTPERAALRGCRFVLIEELPEGRSLSIAEVKRITGMSVITARDLYEKEITYDASHTLFITTNYTPPVAEVDEGSWRRMCLVRFPYRFRANPENEGEKKGDPGLKSRLREGPDGQHDAIITWLVEGAQRYFADRSIIMDDRRPEAIKTATLEWRKEADRVLAYVEERLSFDEPDRCVARSHLYFDFCKFLEERGHNKWSQETFLSRFKSHELIRSRGVVEGQTRNHDLISRPVPPGTLFSGLPVLPKVPRVFRGMSFRLD